MIFVNELTNYIIIKKGLIGKKQIREESKNANKAVNDILLLRIPKPDPTDCL